MKTWKKEPDFQKDLIVFIKERIPGAVVLKNDSSHVQGIPDLSIFHGDKYAMLEVKIDEKARNHPQANQEDYIDQFAEWGAFSRFIYPEIHEQVLADLERYFQGVA